MNNPAGEDHPLEAIWKTLSAKERMMASLFYTEGYEAGYNRRDKESRVEKLMRENTNHPN